MENNNIEIRNLYINKIQKKINNLIHCTKLLNNLNNVINNQIGGSNVSNDVYNNTQKSLETARELLNLQNIKTKQNEIIPIAPIMNNEINDLNNTILELEKFIAELQNKLTNNNNSEDVNNLNQQIIVLQTELKQIKETLNNTTNDLENTRQQLEAAQIIISNNTIDSEESTKKLTQIEDMLAEYNTILADLKQKLPIIKNNEIEKFNNIIQDLINILEIPNIENCVYVNIINKYNAVFNIKFKEQIKNLKTTLNNTIKITTGPTVKNKEIPISPYQVKNQEESDAIFSLVKTQNDLYKNIVNDNDNRNLIDSIKEFKYQFNRANTLINQQKKVKNLTNSSSDFNTYFNFNNINDFNEVK
jgi:chromosome segregation ATPase